MKGVSPGLSKSKLQSFRQCPKRLYLETHWSRLHPDQGPPEPDAPRLNIGHDVNDVARALAGNGVFIGDPAGKSNLGKALNETSAALAKPSSKPLFEATFAHDGLIVRADILRRKQKSLDLVEVKSSTASTFDKGGSKAESLVFDCAIQTWTMRQAGFQPRNVSLALIDSQYVYPGNGDYRGLFQERDVTTSAKALGDTVAQSIDSARKTLQSKKVPDIAPGPQCSSPYPCPFTDHCNAGAAEYPVELLQARKRKKTIVEALLARGVTDVRKVHRQELEDPIDLRIWQAIHEQRGVLEKPAGDWARQQSYPRYYMDFETVQFAVPVWPQTRPYEQLPFQWSVHIERQDGSLEQREFLGDGKVAPMRSFAESLLKTLGRGKHPILTYNMAFEKSVLQGLAHRFPDLAAGIQRVVTRLQDLLPIMRQHYYHPDMNGSWSIKAVLPTVAPDLDYQKLDGVQSGGDAQQTYLAYVFGGLPEKQRSVLRSQLIDYCKLDTLALVRLMQYLQRTH